MNQEKIDRINYLAKKSRESGLNDDEKREQSTLRAEYVASFRSSLERELKGITIVEPDGTEHKLTKKDDVEIKH